MQITIERADGTKVHIEGDEESVARIAKELSPPPVQAVPYVPYYPYPGIDTWRTGRPWWGVEPGITWTCSNVSVSDTSAATYSTGQPS